MNHIKKGIVIVAALLAVASFATAESVWTDYDSAHPLLVRYTGPETATIQVTTISVIQITDTTTTTTTYNGITLAALKAAILAAKDDDGDKEWECVTWAGLDTDTLANSDFTAVAANAVDDQWDTSITEDTSQALFYNVVPQAYPVGKFKGNSGNYTITDLIGEPAGTGDATVSVYASGTRQFYQTITSPFYVYSANSTVNVANASIDLGKMVDLGSGIKIGPSQVGLVRVQRATAATTGGIGASVSRP